MVRRRHGEITFVLLNRSEEGRAPKTSAIAPSDSAIFGSRTFAAAAAAPADVDAQFVVADLDVAGGHVEDAFERLLDLFAALPSGERAPVRERLLELFGLVGDADARVIRARSRLASLLF